MVSILTGGNATAQDVLPDNVESSSALVKGLKTFWHYTGFSGVTLGNLIMIVVGLFFIFLAIKFNYEPLLLVPIGTGILLGNIPFVEGFQIGIYEEGSVLNYLYFGVMKGVYPPLIFLGIGAMTDFSSLISNPRLMILGAAAQIGIFATFIGAMALGFEIHQAGAISIIGGADGPTAIFASSKLAPQLIGSIAIAAYSYMALVPVIQPPIIRLMTSKKREVDKDEAAPGCVKNRENTLSVNRVVAYAFHLTNGASTIGNALLWKLIERVWCYRTFG